METNNYKREIPSFINKYKAHIFILIATLGIVLLGCENKATGAEEQEYYRFTSIVAGNEFIVGIARDGSLWSWGKNDYGQLGDGTITNKSNPVRVQKTGITWEAVSAGRYHTVGIARDGSLWSWGANDYGQLGDGTTTNKSKPVRVQKTGTTWKAVSAGGYHTVGIDSDGILWSWGANDNGQLGDGSKENKSTPVRVRKTEGGTLVDNTTKWEVVVAGYAYTVGIDSDGILWSWGANDNGQLGDGSKENKSTPVRVQKTEEGTLVNNTTKWKAVSAGGYHTVGLAEDGILWSWGQNNGGQLGDGTKIAKSTPVRVQKTGIIWEAVLAGDNHTVGLAEDGILWSWGQNNGGQLGDGTKENKSNPVRVRVDNTTKWKTVSAGANHTVGLAEDGILWSWGSNSVGQLGDGTTTSRNTPVKIQIPK